MVGHVSLRTILLLGLLLAAVLWIGVDTAAASIATVESVDSAQVAILATADDGGTGPDVDPDGGFGATLGIVLGVAAVVAYGYMRTRKK